MRATIAAVAIVGLLSTCLDQVTGDMSCAPLFQIFGLQINAPPLISLHLTPVPSTFVPFAQFYIRDLSFQSTNPALAEPLIFFQTFHSAYMAEQATTSTSGQPIGVQSNQTSQYPSYCAVLLLRLYYDGHQDKLIETSQVNFGLSVFDSAQNIRHVEFKVSSIPATDPEMTQRTAAFNFLDAFIWRYLEPNANAMPVQPQGNQTFLQNANMPLNISQNQMYPDVSERPAQTPLSPQQNFFGQQQQGQPIHQSVSQSLPSPREIELLGILKTKINRVLDSSEMLHVEALLVSIGNIFLGKQPFIRGEYKKSSNSTTPTPTPAPTSAPTVQPLDLNNSVEDNLELASATSIGCSEQIVSHDVSKNETIYEIVCVLSGYLSALLVQKSLAAMDNELMDLSVTNYPVLIGLPSTFNTIKNQFPDYLIKESLNEDAKLTLQKYVYAPTTIPSSNTMLWVVDVKTAATTTTTMPISMLNPAPFSVFPNQFLQAYTNFRQTFTEPQINMGIAHFSTTDLIGICVKFDRTQDLFENRFKAIIANLNVTPIAG